MFQSLKKSSAACALSRTSSCFYRRRDSEGGNGTYSLYVTEGVGGGEIYGSNLFILEEDQV